MDCSTTIALSDLLVQLSKSYKCSFRAAWMKANIGIRKRYNFDIAREYTLDKVAISSQIVGWSVLPVETRRLFRMYEVKDYIEKMNRNGGMCSGL